jgi:hypothetical protein
MSGLFDDLPPPPTDGPYEDRPRASVGVARCDPCANRHQGNPESEQAHANTFHKKEADYARIIEFVRSEGWHGATNQEISFGTYLPYTTVSARCSELLAAGRLRRDGRKRNTTSGSPAAVMVVVENATLTTESPCQQ